MPLYKTCTNYHLWMGLHYISDLVNASVCASVCVRVCPHVCVLTKNRSSTAVNDYKKPKTLMPSIKVTGYFHNCMIGFAT